MNEESPLGNEPEYNENRVVMMKDVYRVMVQRRSMRKFDESLHVSAEERGAVQQEIENLIPLVSDIRIQIKLVERSQTTVKRGEYCLLMYSEKKPHYLLNAGYMLEQMDLFLASRGLGTCWYGLAKPKHTQQDGLDYVIMLAFGKSRPEDFRRQITDFRRKEMKDIWRGRFDPDVMNAVRIAPSACNMQPWRIQSDPHTLLVKRKTGLASFIPLIKIPFYNTIDMGICLCFLEMAMNHKGIAFTRALAPEKEKHRPGGLLPIATYSIRQD